MFYILMFFKIIVLEYLLIVIHEILHLILSFILGLKCSFFHIVPFTIYTVGDKIKFSLKPHIERGITSRSHFNSYNLSYSLEYLILLKKIQIYLWIGPIFDFLIFIVLFCIGVTFPSLFFLTLTSILHFIISTINFFNSDGKSAIGSKEDKRIAFNLIRDFTLCANGHVTDSTKRILTDKHIEICSTITWNGFEVNDLWNFLNNISFYTNSLLSYLNEDIYLLDCSSTNFFDSLINDFDTIKNLDYRQEQKISISIIIYLIYQKILFPDFTPDKVISEKIYKGCNSNYYKKLYDYYFNDIFPNNTTLNHNEPNIALAYLLEESNMPTLNCHCYGYSKLLTKLLTLKFNKIN